MKQAFLIFLLSIPLTILGQECNCKTGFDWAKKTFEENDAGFQYILDRKGEKAYSVHNQLFVSKIKGIINPIECKNVISEWLMFFRKAHVEIHYIGSEKVKEKEEDKENIQEIPAINFEKKATNRMHEKMLSSSKPYLERLNENTLYLRIPSFVGTEKHLIDSVILENRATILRTENLIVDIRNGVGGSDASYAELLPILYTNPIRLPALEFLSTPLNNKRMHELATNTGVALDWGVNPTEEEKKEFKARYDTLSNHLGEFVNLGSSDISITKFDTIYPYPKNVGFMINHNNVSTDEQLLLEARQSKKVKLFGTRTKGGLDVSNLYLTKSPCNDYLLVYALSRSLRIPDMAIDDIGIMPDFYIDKGIPESEWIDYVERILNQ